MTSRTPVVVAVIILGFSSAASAEDAACKVVFDGMMKKFTTANHQYLSRRIDALNGGKPRSSEAISIGDVTYLKIDDRWTRSRISQASIKQLAEDNRKTAKTTCRLVRDESIDGVSTSLYTVHEENDDIKSDSQVWIAKSTGLPARTVMQAEGMHAETRFVYTDVTAPPGVK